MVQPLNSIWPSTDMFTKSLGEEPIGETNRLQRKVIASISFIEHFLYFFQMHCNATSAKSNRQLPKMN